MNKVFLMILAILVVTAGTLWAQPIAETNLAAPAINTYNLGAMPKDQDFITFINREDAPGYADTPIEKGGKGAINTVTAWTEVPREMTRVTEEENLISGCTLGLVSGIASGVGRGIAGIYDAATFVLPPYNEPMMEPDYKAKQPQKDFRIEAFKW